jgi:hypothetical protein
MIAFRRDEPTTTHFYCFTPDEAQLVIIPVPVKVLVHAGMVRVTKKMGSNSSNCSEPMKSSTPGIIFVLRIEKDTNRFQQGIRRGI